MRGRKGGNLVPEARDLIKGFAQRATTHTTSGITSDYARTITSIYQRVGVALQSCKAKMLAILITSSPSAEDTPSCRRPVDSNHCTPHELS